MSKIRNHQLDFKRALLTGLISGTAYLSVMWADHEVSRRPFNDLKLVGQTFTTKSPDWLVLGLIGHYSFSVVMAMVYDTWARRWIPGPPWLKGILFLQIENATLYPGALVVELFHPGIKTGQVPSLLTWPVFWGQVLRHVAFGLSLGLSYRQRKSP